MALPFDDTNSRTGLIGVGPLPSKSPVAAFNPDAIENLLRTKGILAFHVRHALDFNRESTTGGLNVDREGIERPFLFYDARPILIVPQHYSLNEQLTVMALSASETVAINTCGEYLDSNPEKRVFMRPGDLILLNPTCTDMHAELVEYRGESPWLLQHRIKRVDYMASSSVGRLVDGDDFLIDTDGQIVFQSGARVPKIGEAVSVVYEYAPVWTVRSAPHNLRVLPGNSSGHGAFPRTAFFGPQFILCDRSVVKDGINTTNWLKVLEDLDWRQWLTVG